MKSKNLFDEGALQEHEIEMASTCYLMSLVVIIVGLPLPIVNLLATFLFYFFNRKGALFVRWHCMQTLLSQLTMLVFNTIGFWWTISIIFFDTNLSNSYIGYMLLIFLINVIDFVGTIYAAIQVRKGKHVRWWFYGDVVDLIYKI